MASLVKYFFVKLYHAIERYVIKRRSMLRSTMARKRLLVEVEERLNRIKINGKLNGLDDTELSNLVTFHLTNKIDTPDEWNIWLRILPFVTFITIVAAMIFQHCIPCQRYSYMMGRKLLFQVIIISIFFYFSFFDIINEYFRQIVLVFSFTLN